MSIDATTQGKKVQELLQNLIDQLDRVYNEDERLLRDYLEDPNGDYGDTLAKFIIIELCDTGLEDGPRALRSAASQLEAVAQELEQILGSGDDYPAFVRRRSNSATTVPVYKQIEQKAHK